jgi:hypothetical protein
MYSTLLTKLPAGRTTIEATEYSNKSTGKEYNLKGRFRNSWINIINPFRALLVMGSPGSGKSYFIIQHIIKAAHSKRVQHVCL